ncbi:MAG: PLP-dependent aminotransferase family protein [Bacilli bacterium]|jgi:GntR family transcriptional regulator/MocR family aminotransferase|nr:PLP-dependent aminotransferase family protein [Bacilli bacterium]
MITVFLNRKEKKPLYIQLYEYLRDEIENNTLKKGEKLPSKRELAVHLKISQMTIEAAYQQLAVEGYIIAKPRSGFFVQEANFKHPFYPKNKITLKTKEKSVESKKYILKTNSVDLSLFPFSTWAKLARQVLNEHKVSILNESHPQGNVALRQEIANYLYQFRGMTVAADQIIIGSGTEVLMNLVIQLIGKEKTYGIETPGYEKIYRILKNNQVNYVGIPLDNNGIAIPFLEKEDINVLHVTPSHQFPTGIIMPIKRRLEILHWANEKDNRFIVEDDYDSEFRFNGQPIPTLKSRDSQKVIYFNSFSKSLAPSFRINYMILPSCLIEKFQKQMIIYGCSVPSLEQFILVEFLKGGYFIQHLNRVKNRYKNKLHLFLESFQKSAISSFIQISGYDGGLHFIMEIQKRISALKLCKLLAEKQIIVQEISDYYYFKKSNLLYPTLVIGYSGIVIEDIKMVCEEIIQTILFMEEE